MTELRLRATLEKRGPAAAVVLTDEQVAALGEGRKVFPVTATVAGHTFPGRVARMGGENLVGLNKAVRTAAGVEAGDEVDVVLVTEDAPRTVEVPTEVADALAAAGLRDGFDRLAPSRRKELVRWVSEAKKDETRARRLEQLPEKVRALL
ncbi:YdeI/OmpD-associated family protein [Nocardioides sp. GY 10127]|uniref:DUF1905 domain-containing protein n=1 Tax=Nocardioides sp. GY 10127 TaxID=2569762 RepID=UPI0010A75D3D|nr:YdeI/OmpD-associated family protein [Nocardioides sp. GY 10127]TIC78568.1 DUF1905 domain-containing protein [Nocardioides sp. GY 10127]